MLSGNGRHRRPRQAPALLVAAGVTGSAIAIPLLGAASANAADGTTWDKVAECESGGSWSANSGNGYYGGLQISQEDWNKYGGDQYAASADQASRSQQIAVAEKMLADQGTTPWATCAVLSGLSSNSGSVDVDTGVGSGDTDGSTDSSGSTDSAGSPDSSDSSGTPESSTPSDSGSASGKGSGSDSETDKPAGSTETSGSGHGKQDEKHSGSKGAETPESDKSTTPDTGDTEGSDSTPTTTPGLDESDNPTQSVGSWSLVDTGDLSSGGRHRGGSADESVTNGQKENSSGRHASPASEGYTVHAGDTLCSIADSLDVDGGWRALYADNKKAIGSDPNHISAGQTLKVSGETGAE
ncbi:LysM peptidoglycan-binding domain-containing protein [Streptomyces sp. LP11]|uniref:LysM peptidoglycan-binding domain-containing protein n=1 Tax=Streptomyces pyxinicus TaxID=2970331 RepID=A0ABT2AVD5_9ACTN|nr:LysM peptidoglycan-binding domain-containing protein [Streptomyces sp. LP11]MCS0600206.1 LysM peptidoglycan-binding domain-containing protein [Streptomyces sp. LP11]